MTKDKQPGADHLAAAVPSEGVSVSGVERAPGPLTTAMLRELHALQRTGEVGDLLDYGANALAFYARDRVIGALEKRGLIVASPDWTLTDSGRAALAKAPGGAA